MSLGVHPLVALADVVARNGGWGIEWRERPFGRGAELRLFLPDDVGAGQALNVARSYGFTDVSVMQHLADPGAVTYSGWQLVATAPRSMLEGIGAALNDARALVPPTRSLPAPNRGLNR